MSAGAHLSYGMNMHRCTASVLSPDIAMGTSQHSAHVDSWSNTERHDAVLSRRSTFPRRPTFAGHVPRLLCAIIGAHEYLHRLADFFTSRERRRQMAMMLFHSAHADEQIHHEHVHHGVGPVQTKLSHKI